MRTKLSPFALFAALAGAGAAGLVSCETQETIEERRARQIHVIGGDSELTFDETSDEISEGTAPDDGPVVVEDEVDLADRPDDGSEDEPVEDASGDSELDLDDLVVDTEEDASPAPTPRPVVASSEPGSATDVLDALRQGNEAKKAEATYHAKKGDEAFAAGRFQEAIEEYEHAVESDPSTPAYVIKLSRAKFQIGDRTGERGSIFEDVSGQQKVYEQQLLAEIDLRLDRARKLLVEGDADGAYEAASLAVDSIALRPELAGEDRGSLARDLLDRIRRGRRDMERRRHDAVLTESMTEAARQLELERQQKTAHVQDLLRRALEAIRRGEYRKVEELCTTILDEEPDNKVASFWLRSSRERLFKERSLKVIEDRLDARAVLDENFVEATTPYDSIFVFPDDEYWQRVRMRRDRLAPAQIEDPEPIQKIKSALSSTLIDVTFEDSPLRDVIDHFKSVVGINILINPDIDPDDEELHVSQPINQLTALNALGLILKSKELGFTFQENTLVVTSVDEAREPTEFEVYNVSDLLMKIRDFAAPEIRLRSASEEDDSSPISFTEEFSEDSETLDPETLIELIIESSGGEDVWDGDVNKIDSQRTNLLVSATRDLHRKVREVLENLREDSDLYVVIEARFIDINDDFLEDIGIDSRDLGSVNNLGLPFGGVLNDSSTGGNDIGIVEQGDISDVELVMGLDRWAGRVQHIIDGFTGGVSGDNLNAGGGISGGTFQATWLEPFQVNVILRAVQEERNVRQLTAPVVTAHNNERVYVSVITQRAYIADYELVSGGTGFSIIEVADPVIQTFQEGVILDVDPTISHDKKYVTLDVRPTLATLIGGIISTINISLGSFSSVAFQVPIGIPQISLQQSFTSVTVPNGGTVLLGGFKSLDEGKFQSYLPIIGDIPIIKNLARRKAVLSEKRSLVILLTARIVDLRLEEEMRFNPQ